MDEREEPLMGGNVASEVVRVGTTVRKPVTPATDAIDAVLRHLEEVGFSGSPRTLGRDDRDRHILEYIPGVIAQDRQPLSLDDVRIVGHMIRELHDALDSFEPPAHAAWNVVIPPDACELICHNDLAPWNLVINDQRWVFIDWDGAGPGSRLWDIAYAAHGFGGFHAGGNPDQAAIRLAALADGYGLDSEQRRQLPTKMVERTRAMFNLLEHGGRTGQQPWARLHAEGHAEHWGPTSDYIEHHLATWHQTLGT